MQTIYYYFPDNFEYAGQPTEIGDNDLVPQYATTVAPPQPQPNTAFIFDTQTETWSGVDDYRGYKIFNTQTGYGYTLTELGPVPQGYTTEQLPDHGINYPTQYSWDGLSWALDQQAVDAVTAASVRASRNAELARTDFIEGIGLPITNASLLEFAKYRQYLRDIPQQAGFPNQINYSIVPTYVKDNTIADPTTKHTTILQGYLYAVANPL